MIHYYWFQNPSSGSSSCYFCTLPWCTETNFAATRPWNASWKSTLWLRPDLCVPLRPTTSSSYFCSILSSLVCWDTWCCHFSLIVPSLPEGLFSRRGSDPYSQILQSIWTLYYRLLSPTLSSLPELSPNGTEFNEYLNSLSSEISFILPLSYFENLCKILLM